MSDIAACPFCGGNELSFSTVYNTGFGCFVSHVVCTDCGACGPARISSDTVSSLDEAVNVTGWNDRDTD